MQYIIKSLKISFFTSIFFVVVLLCSTESGLMWIGIGDLSRKINILLLQNICSGLMSSSMVATIIYFISYQEKKDTKLNRIFCAIRANYSFLSEFYLSILKIQNLSKNVSIDALRNNDDYIFSIGCAKRFYDFINNQNNEFLFSDDEFILLTSTSKSKELQNEYYRTLNSFLEFKNLQTTKNIEIFIIEAEMTVRQQCQVMAMQDEQQKQLSMQKLQQEVLKKQIEFIEYLTSQKEVIKQILDVLCGHGDSISTYIGKSETWRKTVHVSQG